MFSSIFYFGQTLFISLVYKLYKILHTCMHLKTTLQSISTQRFPYFQFLNNFHKGTRDFYCTCERLVYKPLAEQTCTYSAHAKQNGQSARVSVYCTFSRLLVTMPQYGGQGKKNIRESSKNNTRINDDYVFEIVKEVKRFQTPLRKDQSFAFCQTGLGLNYCHCV